MTIYELIHELKQFPEDAEILIYDKSLNWTNAIDDGEPLALEHAEDGTPIIYLYGE